MQLKKGQIVEVEVEKLAFGGAGLGKCHVPDALVAEQPTAAEANGMVTFVPNVIPGDRVRAALTKIKKNHLEAQLENILTPSPDRISPRCRHFEVCGGCTWQQLDYDKQLAYKEQIVCELLEHLGGWSMDEAAQIMRPIIGCSEPWNYRNKMELSFGLSEETTLEAANANVQLELGFHKPGMRYEVFDLEECFLQSSVVAEVAAVVRDFARTHDLSVHHAGRGEGLLKSLYIREGKNTGDLMINLATSMEPFPQVEAFKALFEGREWRGRLTSLQWTQIRQQRGRPTTHTSHVLLGDPVIREELRLNNGSVLQFDIGPDAFFQPNTKQAEVLYEQAIQLAGLTGQEVVYDLYCGTGTIGLFCAHASQHVYGIELNVQAVDNARQNAERNGITNATFYAGDVGKVMLAEAAHLPSPDVVIVDPPRAGLQGAAFDQIHTLHPQKIVYVSCNPTTLIRDLKLFTEQGYRLDSLQPVDLFPQTYHVENVALLTL